MLSHRQIFATLLLSMMFWVSACNQQPTFEEVYTRVTDAVLQPGDTIPEPQDDVILTVNGKIGMVNADATIIMDRATIEQVGLVEYDVQDPFADRTIVYRGVLMRDLLALWQVAEGAETVRLIALNDYQIDIPLTEFDAYPILFAMQADGEYMQPDFQGPAMLVFPVSDYDLDETLVRHRWIWQIKTIELK